MEDYTEEYFTGFLLKNETEVDHTLRGKTLSGETLNRWTWHWMMSVSRQWTQMSGKNGLSGVLVTGRSKV